jgi:hypothetical protein
MPNPTRICAIDGCTRPVTAKGWCQTHYMHYRRHGSPVPTPATRHAAALRRFHSSYKVADNGCWLWTKGLNSNGYGRFQTSEQRVPAHRWAYTTFVGLVPTDLDIDHLCHNADPSCPGGECVHRGCVNPDHLEPATRQVNLLRGKTIVADQVRRTHCPQGHPLSGDNLYVWHRMRHCRVCRLENWRAWKARQFS